MDVSLGYDPSEEMLLIGGAAENAARHPLFAAYLRQHAGRHDPDGLVRVPTPPEALTARYQAVEKILQRIGARLQTTGHVSDALENVRLEEGRFAAFSKKAYDIWHTDIETEEFREFIDAVERVCGGRRFYAKQLLSAFHLAFAQNACNFSVPGAGKTSIVYAAYAYLHQLPDDDPKHVDRLLVVGPLSSFKAWEDEFEAVFEMPPRSRRISGRMPLRERVDHLRGITPGSREIELTLTSYQTLSNSEDDFRIFLQRGGKRTMMVLDEAHNIKGADGVQAASALRLAPLAASRVILTGTPAPNGYEDLSNLFKFIYPSRNLVGFPLSTLRAMSENSLPAAIPELKVRIQPFFTRIRKADLNLPPSSERRIEVDLENAQQQIYSSLERRIVPQLEVELQEQPGAVRVRARLMRLRQACVNPELLLKPLEAEGIFEAEDGDFTLSELDVADAIRSFRATTDLARLRVCKDLAGQIVHTEGKVLIWSYFLGNLELLRRELTGAAEFVEVLTGATPVAGSDGEEDWEGSREDIIDKFHRPSQTAILIANPQAVGESISLHKACRSAVYFDRDFNAGRFIQSKDRIHRYNPDGGLPVTYYHLVSPDTVDVDIDQRLIVKEQRLAELVDADDIPLLTSLGEQEGLEDIRAIIAAYERRKTR